MNSVLIINIETKKYVCFQTNNNFFMFNELNTQCVLNGNYVYFSIKKYNEKISTKLISHEYFNILNI